MSNAEACLPESHRHSPPPPACRGALTALSNGNRFSFRTPFLSQRWIARYGTAVSAYSTIKITQNGASIRDLSCLVFEHLRRNLPLSLWYCLLQGLLIIHSIVIETPSFKSTVWYLAFEHLLDDSILVRLEVRGQRRKRGVVLRHLLGPDSGFSFRA